jgi:hypothetical protein
MTEMKLKSVNTELSGRVSDCGLKGTLAPDMERRLKT